MVVMIKLTVSLPRALRVAAVCTAATATLVSLTSCDVKQTQEAKAPEVTVKEGQMPKYDVDTAKVTVDSQQKEVTVPKVTTEQKSVTVPDVDVTMPDEQAASPTATATP
jgi:Cu/Ag efflux protein CusF